MPLVATSPVPFVEQQARFKVTLLACHVALSRKCAARVGSATAVQQIKTRAFRSARLARFDAEFQNPGQKLRAMFDKQRGCVAEERTVPVQKETTKHLLRVWAVDAGVVAEIGRAHV